MARNLGDAFVQIRANMARLGPEVKAGVSRIKESVNVGTKLDTAKLRVQLAEIDGKDATVHVKTDVDTTSLRLAAANAGGLRSTLLSLAPAAIPALGALTVATGALSSALFAGAGAGGAFGLSVGLIAKQMTDQQTKMKSLQTTLAGQQKGTEAYRQTLGKLHAEQASFSRDFGPAAAGLKNLRGAMASFVDATKPATVQVMGKALNVAASILPRLSGLSNAAAGAVGGLVDDFGRWANGPEFAGLLNFFQRTGPAAIRIFGATAGAALSGVAGVLMAFAPAALSAASGLQRGAAAFAAWGQNLPHTEGFQAFLAYAARQGPLLAALFSNVATIIGHFVAAAAPLSGPILAALIGISGAIASIPVGILTPLAVAFVAVSAAIRVANVLVAANTARLALMNGMAVASAAAQNAAAAASRVWAAGQWLVNAALSANPIGLVVVAIAALVAGFVIAYRHSATFRAIVQGALRGVAAAGRFMWTILQAALSAIASGLRRVWAAAQTLAKVGGAALRALGAAGRWLWNNAIQPAFRAIVLGVAKVIQGFANMAAAGGRLPGPLGAAFRRVSGALQAAADKARGLADSIRKIPDHHDTKVRIAVSGRQSLDAAQLAIQRMHGKTVNVYVVTHRGASSGHSSGQQRNDIGGNAAGTESWRGGATWVGEHGRELVTLPRGARVVPHVRSEHMARQAERQNGRGSMSDEVARALLEIARRPVINVEKLETRDDKEAAYALRVEQQKALTLMGGY